MFDLVKMEEFCAIVFSRHLGVFWSRFLAAVCIYVIWYTIYSARYLVDLTTEVQGLNLKQIFSSLLAFFLQFVVLIFTL